MSIYIYIYQESFVITIVYIYVHFFSGTIISLCRGIVIKKNTSPDLGSVRPEDCG